MHFTWKLEWTWFIPLSGDAEGTVGSQREPGGSALSSLVEVSKEVGLFKSGSFEFHIQWIHAGGKEIYTAGAGIHQGQFWDILEGSLGQVWERQESKFGEKKSDSESRLITGVTSQGQWEQ